MKRNMKKASLSLIAVAFSGTSSLALAQGAGINEGSEQASPETPVTEENGVEEIVVTAQFRSESLQDVPVAISSLSGDELAASGSTDLTGLSAKVPGLYLSSYSTLSPQLYIRGVGSNDDGITAEGAVGVYVDGIYVGRASAALFDLYDIERVEVLRGPQGTLYGRNTNGGAIRVETTKAGPDTAAAVELGIGNFGQRKVRGMINGGLADNVFAKVAVGYKKRNGWTLDENTGGQLNDEDSLSVRGQLRFEPSPEFETTLGADYIRDRSGSSFKEVVAGSLFGLYEDSPNLFAGSYDLPTAFIKRDIFGLSGQLNWDFGPATLNALSGYRRLTSRILKTMIARHFLLFISPLSNKQRSSLRKSASYREKGTGGFRGSWERSTYTTAGDHQTNFYFRFSNCPTKLP